MYRRSPFPSQNKEDPRAEIHLPGERARVTRQAPPTIAILGNDTVVGGTLALLLEGAGYPARVLQDTRAADASGQLEGAGLVLLAPSLGEGDVEAFLKAVEAEPAARGVRVLALSTAPERELEGRAGVVPWPIPFEGLLGAIEETLACGEEEW